MDQLLAVAGSVRGWPPIEVENWGKGTAQISVRHDLGGGREARASAMFEYGSLDDVELVRFAVRELRAILISKLHERAGA